MLSASLGLAEGDTVCQVVPSPGTSQVTIQPSAFKYSTILAQSMQDAGVEVECAHAAHTS